MKMEFIKRFSILLLLPCLLWACGGASVTEVKNVQMSIEGMSCAHSCAPAIQEKLSKAEGVVKAIVNFDSKSAYVSYDAAQTNPEELKKLVDGLYEQAYTVTGYKEITALPKDSIQ
ncbi:MAG: heavy-metal-associated domain-containing protein [Flavobacteriales bacterium]